MGWILFFFLSAGYIQADQPVEKEPRGLSLDECIELSLEVSPEIQAAEAAVLQKKAQVQVARRSRAPSFELSGGYTRLSEMDNPDISLPSGGSFSLPSSDFDSVSLTLGMIQPLFAGFEIDRGIRTGQNVLLTASLQSHNTRKEVRHQVELSFWSLVSADEQVRVMRKSVERADSLLKQVRSLFSQGMATREEVLRMEMNRERVVLRQLQAEHLLQLSVMQLNLLTGRPAEEDIRPVYTFDESPEQYEVPVFREALGRALAQHTELKVLDLRKEIQKLEDRTIRAGWLPRISVQGQLQYANPHPRQFPPEDDFQYSWQVGVYGSIDIDRLKNRGAELSRSEAAIHELSSREEALIRNISLQIQRDLLEIEKSVEMLASSRIILEQAEENYDINYDKFRSGSAVDSDLLSAQEKLLQAQLERTRAFVALKQAESQLNYDIGYGEGK